MSFPLDRLAVQLDWNLLRTFMVIVQERSITGAAQRLNISQPSVSSALRRLEERLELRLVERGAGQTFVVTRAGEAVYREALEIYGGVVRLNDVGEEGGRAGAAEEGEDAHDSPAITRAPRPRWPPWTRRRRRP